jgi:hypothetical protein
MPRTGSSLGLILLLIAASPAQDNGIAQTPRQALLEMIFSKTPGTFVKHLPTATQAALEKSGAMTTVEQYSLLAGQIHAQGQKVETFETGPLLLSGEDPKTGQKIEIHVVSDVLQGDQDDIALSVQMYKNGQAQRSPFLPQLTFTMKQEAQLWRLNEISFTLRIPLADPDFLKAITENLKPQSASSNATPSSLPRSETSWQAGDGLVTAAIRTIFAAEVTYAKSYPAIGYTCTLSDLDGFGGGGPNEHQAMLINSGLASGKRYGFVFTLTGCGAAPATSFRLSAVPNRNGSGRKSFCVDQAGVIRSSEDSDAANCLAHGTPVQ